MKKMLAHSTVAYLGVLTAIYGYSTGGQVKGELLHIANHAFYKSSLFLMLGWFEKVTGTRDIDLLDREIWYRRQPLGALLFCIAGLSIVGGPLLLSYTAKDLFFDVVFTRNREMWPALLVMVGSILSVA
jgi:NADH:ubiquinone oxidoreductase subunit 5 (subunit L)/multisubunit Na+/H+ antiporter MnhA subunit